MQIRLM